MVLRRSILMLALVALGSGCAPQSAPSAEPGRDPAESGPGGLYGAYREGKFDEAGHPLGSQVFAAGAACRPSSGVSEAEGWGAWPGLHEPGLLCDVDLARLGTGRFTLNARVLTQKLWPKPTPELTVDLSAGTASDAGAAPIAPAPTVLTLRVLDAEGQELARKELDAAAFAQRFTYRNVWLGFQPRSEAPLRLQLHWSGVHPLRLAYLELFRSARAVRIEPPSGLVPAQLRVELMNQGSSEPSLRLHCGEQDLTAALAARIEDGTAQSESGELRTLWTLPASLLDACPTPTRLLAEAQVGPWSTAAARVTYRHEPPSCSFVGEGTRVLLTAFEPFPAAGQGENSSQAAVEAFDPTSLPGLAVAKVILPVEWDSAGEMVDELIRRCKPEVVVGFGQGRWRVEPETIAYNRQDTSDLAGGVPDNRGFVRDGQPILKDGAATFDSLLPTQAIVDALAAAGIDAATSDDAGRYICNEVFYRISRVSQERGLSGGFVHLPQRGHIDADERARLGQVVRIVLEQTLQARAAAQKAADRR